MVKRKDSHESQNSSLQNTVAPVEASTARQAPPVIVQVLPDQGNSPADYVNEFKKVVRDYWVYAFLFSLGFLLGFQIWMWDVPWLPQSHTKKGLKKDIEELEEDKRKLYAEITNLREDLAKKQPDIFHVRALEAKLIVTDQEIPSYCTPDMAAKIKSSFAIIEIFEKGYAAVKNPDLDKSNGTKALQTPGTPTSAP